MRLNKAIAQLGICSRRKADELIASGLVRVNDVVVTEMGTQVELESDSIHVEGYSDAPTSGQDTYYVAMHKPVDYISSASNEQGQSVLDLLTIDNYLGKQKDRAKKATAARLYPVGRLDKDSEGLILLTNDGELTNELTHPRYEHEKEYEVTIDRALDKPTQKILKKGMHLSEGEYVKGIDIVHMRNVGKRSVVTVVLTEGKNRQIRRMFGQLGYPVLSLKRTRINNLQLKTLPQGRWRLIRRSDIM